VTRNQFDLLMSVWVVLLALVMLYAMLVILFGWGP
jgi:hypothetical protein